MHPNFRASRRQLTSVKPVRPKRRRAMRFRNYSFDSWRCKSACPLTLCRSGTEKSGHLETTRRMADRCLPVPVPTGTVRRQRHDHGGADEAARRVLQIYKLVDPFLFVARLILIQRVEEKVGERCTKQDFINCFAEDDNLGRFTWRLSVHSVLQAAQEPRRVSWLL